MRILKKAAMLFALTKMEKESYRALGLDNPCEVVPNGVAGFKLVQEKFTWDKIVSKLVDVYVEGIDLFNSNLKLGHLG